MSVPVNDAAAALLEVALLHYQAAVGAREAIWREEYRRAERGWARHRRPSPAGIDDDRIVVTAMQWLEEQHLHAVQYANSSELWIKASHYTSEALLRFNEVRRLLDPSSTTEEQWFIARRHVTAIEWLASEVAAIRSQLFGA